MPRLSPLQVGRLAVLFLTTFFSSIILGLLTQLAAKGETQPRVLLSVAVSALVVLTIPAMILIDMFRQTVTFLTYIISEVIWLGILSFTWLVAALLLPLDSQTCRASDCDMKINASRIFAFLSFVTLLPYIIVLLTASSRLRRSSDRPAHVWTGSVRDVFAPGRPLVASAAPLPTATPLVSIALAPATQPPTPLKSGFGFVVEADDDPFHPEPVSSRATSMLLSGTRSPTALSPTSPTSTREGFLSPSSPVFVALPCALPTAHLQG
ncbi:hypothetical protein PsYK624_086230 [Phanerochaete sordida]|uniref:MARVEL domain-containing protein n=1 Tax=Phanerochaete sordida TaxID=48140 RepID=A0A9P3LFC0_9APHY|nr:hypothetical protein PsYK624_086230 [Phanerochaete sordida]